MRKAHLFPLKDGEPYFFLKKKKMLTIPETNPTSTPILSLGLFLAGMYVAIPEKPSIAMKTPMKQSVILNTLRPTFFGDHIGEMSWGTGANGICP